MVQRKENRGVAGWLLNLALRLPGGRRALGQYLLQDGRGAVAEAVRADDSRIVRELLAEDSFALLRAVAVAEDNAALNAILFANDFALFRAVAEAADGTALKSLLFTEDYRALKRLLALNGHAALKAIVLDGEPSMFSLLVRAREGRPLAEALFADEGALLRAVCRVAGDEALLPVLHADAPRYLAALPAALKSDLAAQLVALGASPPLAELLRNPAFLAGLRDSARAAGVLALAQKWYALAGVIPADDPHIEERFRAGLAAIQSPEHVRGRVLDAITEGDIVRLARGTLQFPCRHSLWTLLHEILLNEDYYFEHDGDAPVVIDGGAHMGMAIYYVKSLYPNARITAFEPVPALHAMAEANVARNGYRDVTVLPYALAAERKSATFHVSEQWSMAGALSDRRARLGEEVTEATVDCVPLSDYLDGLVDLLKLDIEGAEDEVLEEAAPKLGNVRHLFCEFHQGGGLPSGRLGKILAILEGAGFDVQVGKSHNYQATSRHRPLTHFGGSASMVIWARRLGAQKDPKDPKDPMDPMDLYDLYDL